MPSNGHGQGHNLSRKGHAHDKRNKPHTQHKDPESASTFWSVGPNGSSDSGSRDGGETKTRTPRLDYLDFEKFISLPLFVMANTCKFLQLEDLITLSRTCVKLRALLMSKISKPCWDRGRRLQNIPEWKGVAAPRAAAFLFDDACQGRMCNEPAPLKTFYVCKRYCQNCGPEHLLSAEQVLERCPGIPLRFINLLPWTRTRASKSEAKVDVGRFVLLDDVKSLQRRLVGFDPENKEALSSVETELGMRLKQSRIAKCMEDWLRGFEGRLRHAGNARFAEFAWGLQNRWGWIIKQMPEVTTKRRFDELLIWVGEVPELNQNVWDKAEKIIRDILSKSKKLEAPSRRPWSLTKAVDSASSSGPTALLLDNEGSPSSGTQS